MAGAALRGVARVPSVSIRGEDKAWHEPNVIFRVGGMGGEVGKVSFHDWIFASQIDPVSRHRLLSFSSTLVLSGVNALESLGIDDPDKAKWRDFIFRARGRDLKGAIFDFGSFPRIDFEGADLERASLQCGATRSGLLSKREASKRVAHSARSFREQRSLVRRSFKARLSSAQSFRARRCSARSFKARRS